MKKNDVLNKFSNGELLTELMTRNIVATRPDDDPVRRVPVDNDTFDKLKDRTVDEPKKGFDVICSSCHQPTTVPFKPNGDWPVYCLKCYNANKKRGD